MRQWRFAAGLTEYVVAVGKRTGTPEGGTKSLAADRSAAPQGVQDSVEQGGETRGLQFGDER